MSKGKKGMRESGGGGEGGLILYIPLGQVHITQTRRIAGGGNWWRVLMGGDGKEWGLSAGGGEEKRGGGEKGRKGLSK